MRRPSRAHRLQVLAARDEVHVGAALRQPRAEVAAQAARTHDRDAHAVSCSCQRFARPDFAPPVRAGDPCIMQAARATPAASMNPYPPPTPPNKPAANAPPQAAAPQGVGAVHPGAGGQLPGVGVPLPERRRADHRAVHGVPRGGRQGQRRSRSTAAARASRAASRRRSPGRRPTTSKQAGQPPRAHGIDRSLLPPPRTAGTFTTELPAFFDREPRDLPDRARRGDQRGADPAGQRLGHAALGFGPAILLIALLRVDVPARGRAGRRHGGMGMGGMFGIGRSKARRYDADDAPTASPSTTSRASTRPRTNWSRSSTSSRRRRSTRAWAAPRPRACC